MLDGSVIADVRRILRLNDDEPMPATGRDMVKYVRLYIFVFHAHFLFISNYSHFFFFIVFTVFVYFNCLFPAFLHMHMYLLLRLSNSLSFSLSLSLTYMYIFHSMVFTTCYMATSNSSQETKDRAQKLSDQIGRYTHKQCTYMYSFLM